MVIIILYLIVLCITKRELSNNNKVERRIYIICTMIGVLLAILYRAFLISLGIEHGLANRDMRYYMDLAERIQSMSISDGFATISAHWNFWDVNPIQIWGYRLYIYYLTITIFKWTLLSVDASVYLVSIFQILVGSYSGLIIYNSIKKRFIVFEKTSLVLILLAPPVWFGSVRLLRECFMFLCIACLVRIYSKKGKYRFLKAFLPGIVLTVMRPYYTLFMIPILLLINKKGYIARSINLAIFLMLAVVCLYIKTPFSSIIGVVLSPNFFNQVHFLDMSAIENIKSTGYIPVINYIGSLWNFIMLVFVAITMTFRRKSPEIICSFTLLLDICMTYAIAFGGDSELRHKMFFVIPYIIMLNEGLKVFHGRTFRMFLLILLSIFLILYSSIVFVIGI